jgi:hypothetical protein
MPIFPPKIDENRPKSVKIAENIDQALTLTDRFCRRQLSPYHPGLVEGLGHVALRPDGVRPGAREKESHPRRLRGTAQSGSKCKPFGVTNVIILYNL